MKTARIGQTVEIEVQSWKPDGSLAIDCATTEFELGAGDVIPGIEEAVTGMKEGEVKSVQLSPPKAFGAHDETKVVQMQREQLPRGFRPDLGRELPLSDAWGNVVLARVTEVRHSTVKLDYNHPLAGNALQFEVRLLKVR